MQISSDSPTWLRHLAIQISQTHDLQAILEAAVADLQSYLEINRVKICQFQSDGWLQVIAEVIHDSQLPSLRSRHFPPSTLVPYSESLLKGLRVGGVVDVKRQVICQIIPPSLKLKSPRIELTKYLPINSSQAKCLIDMGVKFAIVMPIFHHEANWGLLVAHHSEEHFISAKKVEVLQMTVDQLSIAVAQQALRTHVQTKAEQEDIFNRIATLLQASSTAEFQAALETAVAAFQGSGGRLCMSNPTQTVANDPVKNFTACLATSGQAVKVYTCGVQPEIPAMPHAMLMEQYRLWQDHYQSGDYSVWPILNLYQTPELQPLYEAFRPTPIASLLMIPLTYRQQLVGYLSIFRNAIASNSSQTGSVDSKQLAQGQEWTDLEFAQKLGQQFAIAIDQHQLSQPHQLSQQFNPSNTHFNTELQQQTAQLEKLSQQQQGLSEILAKIKEAVDPETIFQTTTKELCHLLNAERVSVYRFNADWGGEFVYDFEYVTPAWQRTSKLGRNTAWNDTYLQQTEGGRYRHNETFSADDIYQANLSSCHIEILEQFSIKAFATAPVFVGKRLWGVLAAYQHSQARHWLDTDIVFLSQTATSLGLALQQAELMAKNQDIVKSNHVVSNTFNLGERSLPPV